MAIVLTQERAHTLLTTSIKNVKVLAAAPEIEDDLVVESLTSPHRDHEDVGEYASDGNRELVRMGRDVALETCIHWGARKDQPWDESRIKLWRQLRTHVGACQVFENSILRNCIVTSIRQNNDHKKAPISERVGANAAWAFIGLVYEHNKQHRFKTCHISATCRTINVLCQYLEPGISTDASRPTSQLTASSTEGRMPGSLESDGYQRLSPEDAMELDQIDFHTMYHSNFDFNALGPQPDDSLADLSSLMRYPYQELQSDGGTVALSTVERDHTSFTTGDLADELCAELANFSLAHASLNGQKCFVVTTIQPLARKQSSPRAKKSRSTKTSPQSRRNTESVSVATVDLPTTVNTTLPFRQFAATVELPPLATSTNQKTMRKLFMGTVSKFRVMHIKDVLGGLNSLQPRTEMPVSERREKSKHHYGKVRELSTSHISIEKHYHLYQLYLAVRDEFLSDLDDSFINSSKPIKHSGPGNPITKGLSIAYERMLNEVEPDVQYDTRRETVAKKSIEKMRNMGYRLHLLCKAFGIGALALLPFQYFGSYGPPADQLTESLFCTLPETNLSDLIDVMRRNQHPIVEFARLAEPIVESIVNRRSQRGYSFRCEEIEAEEINLMEDGSAKLLSLLEIV